MPRVSSRRWCFTLNNPTLEESTLVADFLNGSHVRYGVIGRERGESGTPHLQGFFILGGPWRVNRVRGQLPRAHLEPARGTSIQASDYCKKDGDFDEFGEIPARQGARNDLEELYAWGDEFTQSHGRAPTSPEIARAHPTAYLRYTRVARLFEARAATVPTEEGDPREWQDELAQELEEPCNDDRKITFYVDPVGNSGKSWFCRWFLTKFPNMVQLLGPGKRADLAHAIDASKTVFLFNIPRQEMEYLQYSILEALKDRFLLSTKYSSKVKVWATVPHVVVFCNEEPDMTRLSEDRYDIRNI